MSTNTLPRPAPSRPQRRAGPVLTPTRRPGLLAAVERVWQRMTDRPKRPGLLQNRRAALVA